MTRVLIPYDSASDCNLRWGGCFGRILTNNILVFIHSVRNVYHEEGKIRIRGAHYTEETGMWEDRPEEIYLATDLDMSHIHIGNVDVGNAAFYVGKSSGGSYRLGVCEGRYTVYSPYNQALRALGFAVSSNLATVVPKMYSPKYRTLDKGTELIMSKKIISSSVTASLSIGLHPRTKGLALFKNTKQIGEYDPNKNIAHIPYKHQYFVEEVQEAGFTVSLTKGQKDGT